MGARCGGATVSLDAARSSPQGVAERGAHNAVHVVTRDAAGRGARGAAGRIPADIAGWSSRDDADGARGGSLDAGRGPRRPQDR